MSPKRPASAIVYLTLAIAALLFLLAKPTIATLESSPFVSIAQLAALLGIALFALSFVLASRTRLVEEACGGLDRAYGLHHRIGVWSFLFLLIHFVGIMIGYAGNGVSLPFLATRFPIILGEIAILTMAAIILTIIYAKIKYQYFVTIQKFFAVPFAFGVYHLLIVNSDVSRYMPLRVFMIAVVSLGALAWIYREIFYRIIGPSTDYTVKKIIDMGSGVVEIIMSPTGRSARILPGQFAYFSFLSKNVSPEPHPFSFTSDPKNNELNFAAKGLGDFTNTLGQTTIGDRVKVFGPYGKFFERFDDNTENVLIAGGIGITPYLSLLRAGRASNKTMIFYCTNSELDAVYGNELKELSEKYGFKYFSHESDRRGYITADIIDKRASGLAKKHIYLCGPSNMMDDLTKQIVSGGIPRKNIFLESFTY